MIAAKYHLILFLFPALAILTACGNGDVVVRITATSDVHGMIYPRDLIRREPSDHSLAHVYRYATERRESADTLFLLLDNGDFLQGQPSVYYYNFRDTTSIHLSARVMNYLGYDAATVGNHDIEAGPAVYGRIREEFNFPWLAANAVSTGTGNPYFEPYTILESGGKRIAVLGLVTPGIPNWLPRSLWPGMEFRDMVETAREWVPRIMEQEKPDLLVGLFHAGVDPSYGNQGGAYMNENASLLVAREVPGFDLIFAGHDHRTLVRWVENASGDSVLVVNPGSHARFAGEVTVTFRGDAPPGISGSLVPMNSYEPSPAFLERFDDVYQKITAYLDDTVTWLNSRMTGMDALFGPSALTSLVHRVQMDISGAPVSLTAPLSISTIMEEGPVLVSDLFQLYRYENMLYRMELTGQEIDGFLEHAAGIWFNTMTGPHDHLLLFEPGNGITTRLAHPYYNFSSAAGIMYRVDVSKTPGNRVEILRFSDGSPFDPSGTYQVAVNSYRGNGGGGHLTRGAGIPREKLSDRVTWTSDHDLRQYLLEYLSERDTVSVTVLDHWKIIPGEWAGQAAAGDRRILE